MKKMKKMVLIVVLAFSLVLGPTVAAMAATSSSTIVDGGFVSANFQGGSIYGKVIEDDYYLNVSDAIKYANKISVSSAEAIKWCGASFIPIIGPAIGVYGTATTTIRSQAVTNIRKYTDKNKKVHVTVCSTNGVSSITVSEWNGTYGQIKSSLAWASNLGVKFSKKYWKIYMTIYYM